MGDWERVAEVYKQLSADGMLIVVFYIALLYIWIADREKEYRNRLVYPSLILFFLILNPVLLKYVWIQLFYGDDQLLMVSRAFVFLPVVFVIAYFFTRLLQDTQSFKKKTGIFIGMLLILILSSNLVYTDFSIKKSENRYGVPQSIIEIAAFVTLNNKSPKLAVPIELANYFRQFDSNIKLLFSEYHWDGLGVDADTVREEMKQDWPDIKKVTTICKANDVDYLIFNSEYHRFTKSPAEFGYEFLWEIDGFDIYSRVEAGG